MGFCKVDVDSDINNKEGISENIKKLRELTPLLDFSNLISVKSTPFIKLNMIEGESFMIGLHKEKDVAVAREFASMGTKFPEHKHEEIEYLIVYKGQVIIRVDDNDLILEKGDLLKLEPNQTHKAYFPEDTWFLAITIPASKNWPGEIGDGIQ
jgi:quercetin dioxygenase-like cupin family protein